MPNNFMGSDPDPDIVIPRMPIAKDPGFDVIRTLDGRIGGGERDEMTADSESSMEDSCEIANIHQVHGGANYDGS